LGIFLNRPAAEQLRPRTTDAHELNFAHRDNSICHRAGHQRSSCIQRSVAHHV